MAGAKVESKLAAAEAKAAHLARAEEQRAERSARKRDLRSTQLKVLADAKLKKAHAAADAARPVSKGVSKKSTKSNRVSFGK